ncbi:MAG: HAD-IA family hydrolase [Planctomycetaceae bacterium]|nr:HAD-IA family hydrolase [Planctomycetaceae bacterium]MBV8556672.1 HAD-IA family hydrolase [Planctomycetaceae bacterium]
MFTKSTADGIQGIVLDAVGTLIDPSPPVAEVYAAAARRQGVHLEVAVVKSRFQRHFRDDELDEARGPLATDEPGEYRRWRRIVTSVLGEVPDPRRAFDELWDHFGRPEAWSCFPDVAPALRAIREAGLAVRIASNFDARLRSVVAGLRELSEVVEPVIISSEVGFRKPHPAFFRATCEGLGLPPDRVLCVGDDPDNDVRGAVDAGLRGLLLDRRGRRPEDLPFVTSLAELPVPRRD